MAVKSKRSAKRKTAPSRKKAAPKKKVSTPNRRAAKSGKSKRPSQQEALLKNLTDYVRAHAETFLQDPNITSVGVGYKIKGGKQTDQLSLQFTVGEKVRPEALGAYNTKPIPTSVNVGGVDIPTDVIERTFSPAYRIVEPEVAASGRARRQRAEIMRPGISVGATTVTAGTLGAFVRDRESGQTVILSNWHVLHGSKAQIGADIVQPGPHDDNRVDRNKIGVLLRSHIGPAGDCAISSISGRNIANEALELGVPVARIGDPDLGDRIVKSGRTTGVTYGVVTRISVNTRINYGGGVVETVGGFEIGPDSARPATNNEISRGGDSGSAWLAMDARGKPTDIMLGLHFAGDTDEGGASEFALACYAKSVFTKLEIDPLGAASISAQAVEDRHRRGFDRDFLTFRIEAPTFTRQRFLDIAALDGNRELKYCHFSVWLSKKRRYPLCVAWNIDGSSFKRLNRTNFRNDSRGNLEAYQFNNDVYKNNVWDRGHVARRADLCWGTLPEAKQGNYDSFYYTNIAPQHEAFNQSDDYSFDSDGGVWGRLENAVFDSEAPHDLKVSVMGGPVFSARDKKFTQEGIECILPREFWKVVAFKDDDDGREKAFAFLLTQAELVDDFVRPEGLNFDDWVWARISFDDLEAKTGVRFPSALKSRESQFSQPQSLGRTSSLMPVMRREDYFA